MSTEGIKKRNRKILVCGNCHKKKRKCDRQQPCTSCVNLSIDDTCSYSTPASKRQHLNNQYTFHSTTPQTIPSNGLEANTQSIDSTIHKKIDSLNQKIQELEAALTVSALQNDRTSYNIEKSKRDIENGRRQVTHHKGSNDEFHDSKESKLRIGVNPVGSAEDEINFMDSLHKSPDDEKKVPITGYGPLRFLILAKRDPFTKIIMSYLASPSLQKFSYDSMGVFSQLGVHDLETLNQKSLEHFGKSHIKMLGEHSSHAEVVEVKNAISEFGLSLGICFHNEDLSLSSDLLAQIKQILPTRRVLNMLLDIFFESLYPYFPIFDEFSFRSEICQILGEGRSKEDEMHNEMDNGVHTEVIDVINVKGKRDIVVLTSLLVMVRLSYLSLFNYDRNKNREALNSMSSEDKNKKYLLQHPVPLETIYVAESCINEYGMTSQPTLALFQALLMFQIYKTHAPEEDSFSKYESTIHIGNLYQMANSLFLNRDPDYCYNFFENKVDEGTKLLKRKIWYHLITIDIEDSVIYGTPIHTNNSTFDTSLPFIPPNISINNLSFEKKIIDSITELHSIIKSLHSILEIIFRVKSDIKISYLAKLLSEFETLIQEKIVNGSELLGCDASQPSFLTVKKIKLYLQSKLTLLYIYYGFYIYYEHKQNIHNSFFYLKKLLAIIFLELENLSENYLKQCDEKFGSVFNLIISPIYLAFVRMQSLLILISLRIICTKKLMNKKNQRTSSDGYQITLYNNVFKNILDAFEKIVTKNFLLMATFKDKYFYGWKLQKTHAYGLSIVEDENLYNEEYLSSATFKFSLEEYIELGNLLSLCNSLIDTTLTRYDRTEGNSTYTQKDQKQLYDFQIEKLWMLLELIKQEEQRKSQDKKYSANGPMQSSNSLGNINLENIIPPNELDGQLTVDDFIFDFNPFSTMSFYH